MIKKFVAISSVLALASSAFAADFSDKPFVKKRYSIKGSAKIELVDGKNHLVFSEDFKTKNGPDLKIYLSKLPIEALSAKDVDQNSVRLSVLKSNKGTQSYVIPSNLNLQDYESIIIHCEAYTVLWGGFDL